MLFNREISWIQFNGRVLHEALDSRTPLLERVKFLQIFTTNLDEFFMKRVGGLKRQAAAGVRRGLHNQPGPIELLAEIRSHILPLLKLQAECWKNGILPALREEGIVIARWDELNLDEQAYLEGVFERNLFPVLTPLAVGPGLPFPFLSNLSNSLGVLLQEPSQGAQLEESASAEVLFARLKIPRSFPMWTRVPAPESEGYKFVSVKEVITRFIGRLFPGMEVAAALEFRVTRNADIERGEEDAEDLLEMITEELKERKFADVVRLEHGPSASPVILELLKNELEIENDDIYENEEDIDFSQLAPIFELNRRDLKYRPWTPVMPGVLQGEERSIFNVIRESDFMVQHPYESFHESVEKFVQTAVEDPRVLAIKMTLYRTGTDSPFIPLLIKAAEDGKQVVCLVELKARFDEEKNIQVARSLEKAGVHVVYGIVGLKTHCKVTLVVRQEEDQVRSYAHIGTGNYHASTAKLYTDFGLFTANPAICDDVVQLFHFLTGRSLKKNYKKLLVAPIQMKQTFLNLIQFEAEEARNHRPARIIAKMNSLEDVDIIAALYEASQAGVQIDLIVRGFCCLKPQVPNLSENIRVISIIGRFLEHSRVFHFQHGAKDPLNGTYLIGSADWMSRNLSSRIEAVVPIEGRDLKIRLFEFLQVFLNDQRQAWDLDSKGIYRQRHSIAQLRTEGSQDLQMRLYESVPDWSTRGLTVSH